MIFPPCMAGVRFSPYKAGRKTMRLRAAGGQEGVLPPLVNHPRRGMKAGARGRKHCMFAVMPRL